MPERRMAEWQTLCPEREDFDVQETTVQVVHALTGSAIMEIHKSEMDFYANSAFMLAVLFVAAKKLNVPRVCLVLLEPQASSFNTVRCPVLQQIPTEETMEWLCTQDSHCALCGDAGEPNLEYEDACALCAPFCLCLACHVDEGQYKYCLSCLPPELEDRLDAPRKVRLGALKAYWEASEGDLD